MTQYIVGIHSKMPSNEGNVWHPELGERREVFISLRELRGNEFLLELK